MSCGIVLTHSPRCSLASARKRRGSSQFFGYISGMAANHCFLCVYFGNSEIKLSHWRFDKSLYQSINIDKFRHYFGCGILEAIWAHNLSIANLPHTHQNRLYIAHQKIACVYEVDLSGNFINNSTEYIDIWIFHRNSVEAVISRLTLESAQTFVSI